MKWSFKVFTAFGIGVYLHVTFLLLLVVVAMGSWGREGRIAEAATSLLLLAAVFGSVLVHEFGHALTARRFGIRTRDITLLPIGGLARLERIPDDPRQELAIAVAGPAVNLAIVAILFPIGMLLGWGPAGELIPGKMVLSGKGVVADLLWINLTLAIFNFVPAFPMDGGRVLRALLALRLNYVQATRIAVGIGQALAFGFGIFALLNGPLLLALVAFFVYMGAAQEGALAEYRYSFRGLPASCAMMTNFTALSEEDRLEKAVEHLLLGSQIDFPVLRGQQVVGLLTRGILIDSLGKMGPQATLVQVPLKQVTPLDHALPLDIAYETLQTQGVRCLPVMRRGELIGLITLENLAEFAMVQSAMRMGRPAA